MTDKLEDGFWIEQNSSATMLTNFVNMFLILICYFRSVSTSLINPKKAQLFFFLAKILDHWNSNKAKQEPEMPTPAMAFRKLSLSFLSVWSQPSPLFIWVSLQHAWISYIQARHAHLALSNVLRFTCSMFSQQPVVEMRGD